MSKKRQPKFKPGDKVHAHRPENIMAFPTWVNSMDNLIGKELTVVKSAWLNRTYCYYVNNINTVVMLRESWLTPVVEHQDIRRQVGDSFFELVRGVVAEVVATNRKEEEDE